MSFHCSFWKYWKERLKTGSSNSIIGTDMFTFSSIVLYWVRDFLMMIYRLEIRFPSFVFFSFSSKDKRVFVALTIWAKLIQFTSNVVKKSANILQTKRSNCELIAGKIDERITNWMIVNRLQPLELFANYPPQKTEIISVMYWDYRVI